MCSNTLTCINGTLSWAVGAIDLQYIDKSVMWISKLTKHTNEHYFILCITCGPFSSLHHTLKLIQLILLLVFLDMRAQSWIYILIFHRTRSASCWWQEMTTSESGRLWSNTIDPILFIPALNYAQVEEAWKCEGQSKLLTTLFLLLFIFDTSCCWDLKSLIPK